MRRRPAPPGPDSIKLPAYAIVGRRPVKAEPTPEGGMKILAFDWNSGDFVGDASYTMHLFFPSLVKDPDDMDWDATGDIEYVTKSEFDKRVEAFRRELPR